MSFFNENDTTMSLTRGPKNHNQDQGNPQSDECLATDLSAHEHGVPARDAEPESIGGNAVGSEANEAADATPFAAPPTEADAAQPADRAEEKAAEGTKGKDKSKKPHKPKKDLAKFHHAAGHIVMAYLLGVPIPQVSKRRIKKRPEDHLAACCGDFTSVKEIKAAQVIENEVLVQLAGGLAEELHRNGGRLTSNSTRRLSASAYAVEWAKHWIADNNNAGTDRFGSFPKHSKTIQAQVEYLTSFAQDIFTTAAVKAALQVIAKKLEENETLEGADAQMLLENHFQVWQEQPNPPLAPQDSATGQTDQKSFGDDEELDLEKSPQDSNSAAEQDLQPDRSEQTQDNLVTS
jgi:hypothetical protein